MKDILFQRSEFRFDTPAPIGMVPSGAVLEQVLEQLDQAVVLAELAGEGAMEMRFSNRAARRLLAGPAGQLSPSLEDALRRTVGILGPSSGPIVDHWVCAGRPLRARVRRVEVGGAQLVSAELEAEPMMPREGTAALAEAFSLDMQEARLLRLIWRGLGNDEIGGALGIPAGTVKSRLYRLFRRLGVRTRAQAAVLAADLLARAGAAATSDTSPVAGTV